MTFIRSVFTVVTGWMARNGVEVIVSFRFWGTGEKGMNLKLERTTIDEQGTVGSLYCDGVFICHTLEDPARKVKIYGQTCVPSGIYRVDYTHSGRFGRMLPLLGDVPLFFGIRIHGGNKTKDTDGCILTVTDISKNQMGEWFGSESQKALEIVCAKFEADPTGKHTIEIIGGYSASEMNG